MNQQILHNAIEKYGADNQLNQCMEELAELIIDINKYKRGYNNKLPLISEMADVLVCMEYLKIILDIQEADIQEQIEYKLERLKYRMNMTH